MIKSVFLISTALILCSCASNSPAPESQVVNTVPETAQSNVSPSLAATEEDVVPPQVEPDPAMEVVEVEGIKEKCTMERVTGSRIPQRYCRKVGADEQQREAAKGWLDATKRRPMGVTPGQKG